MVYAKTLLIVYNANVSAAYAVFLLFYYVGAVVVVDVFCC
jgi:hypothetical protein